MINKKGPHLIRWPKTIICFVSIIICNINENIYLKVKRAVISSFSLLYAGLLLIYVICEKISSMVIDIFLLKDFVSIYKINFRW